MEAENEAGVRGGAGGGGGGDDALGDGLAEQNEGK